jgi:oxygen-dependent protoporphyrinogen oxidase
VIVAGAGLSGLACAFDLVRGGAEVVVLEAGERAGGVVDTIERDGFRFETGPNTVQASSESFRRLCGDLGIAGRLIASSPAAEERYLFVRGRLRRLPVTPASFLSSDVLSVGGRLRVCCEVLRRWRPPPPGAEEPNLQAFFLDRFGSEATRVLAGGFVRGVYAAELRDLGARSAFPRMWKACEEHGGLVRGLRAASRRTRPVLPGPAAPPTALLSFPLGLREVVDALVTALGSRVRTKTPLASVERRAGAWIARTAAGESIEGHHLVLAVAAPVAAKILAPEAAGQIPIEYLTGIGHASVTLVHLGLDASEVRRPPPGFGYLVPPQPDDRPVDPSRKEPRALGTIFASNLFPGRAPAGCVAVSSFYRSSEVQGLDEKGLVELACEDLSRAVGPADEAIGEGHRPSARTSIVQHWTDVIPRYAPGHADRMVELARAVSERLPGIHLSGSYVAGVSVDQVIACGRATAETILRDGQRGGAER